MEMNKSIKLLHEVLFVRAEVFLKSEVDESVYKTPTAKPKTCTLLNRALENTNSQTLSAIQQNCKCTSEPNAHPKRSVRKEKPASEKHLATPIFGSQTSQNEPSAVGSQTPREPRRGRPKKESKRHRSRSTNSSSSDNASSNWNCP